MSDQFVCGDPKRESSCALTASGQTLTKEKYTANQLQVFIGLEVGLKIPKEKKCDCAETWREGKRKTSNSKGFILSQ